MAFVLETTWTATTAGPFQRQGPRNRVASNATRSLFPISRQPRLSGYAIGRSYFSIFRQQTPSYANQPDEADVNDD